MPSSSGHATGPVGGLDRAVGAAGHRGAHHRLAGLAHHRLDVFEVDVDQRVHVDDVADAAHRVASARRWRARTPRSCVTSSPSTSSSFSFRITIRRVDVGLELGRHRRRPAARGAVPSNSNGLVTTPTVRMPMLLGDAGDHRRRAGAGAAAHAGGDEHACARRRSSRACGPPASSAAALPAVGLAHRHRARCRRAGSASAAVERLSACASVLAQMNSTSCTPLRIMCSTALPPPPPTPITLI